VSNTSSKVTQPEGFVMNCRTTVVTAALTVAVLGALPSQAATKAKPKPKPKPITGSYALTLVPDPSPNVTNVANKPGCGVVPQGQDKHGFTVPAAGTLRVVLDSPDPTGKKVTDWDLYLLDTDGILSSSTGATSHEEVAEAFSRKTAVTIWVCNLVGAPNGTVSYTFTYK
jgi:hypothetical protein